ncbi:MAG: tail fiber domain-containing protein [Planctomycetes bacterium]|nr:tail fiber domain-containing protein [Planctomycetota bacterium]
MRAAKVTVLVLAGVLLMTQREAWAAPMGTAFTYQGHLEDGSGAVTAACDFEFSLWDADVAGNEKGTSPQSANGVDVEDGLFTVTIDFGADAFDNSARWLEIVVDGIPLMPRQPITRAPYSIQTRGIFVAENQRVGIGTNSPSNRLTVAGGDADFTGKVGIGTSDPDERLHVVGDAIITNNLEVNDITANYVESNDISVYSSIMIGDEQDTDGYLYVNREQVGAVFKVETPNGYGGTAMRIKDDGTVVYVGIGGHGSGNWTLEVYGSAAKPGGGSWSNSSDRRLKKNIRNLDGTLEKVLRLRGVSFEYIDPEAINELSGERIGMIAQEVEKVFPDWVDEGADGYKFLTVRGFTALTVEALRELRAEKDAQITELQARLTALEALVQQFVSPSHGGDQ